MGKDEAETQFVTKSEGDAASMMSDVISTVRIAREDAEAHLNA